MSLRKNIETETEGVRQVSIPRTMSQLWCIEHHCCSRADHTIRQAFCSNGKHTLLVPLSIQEEEFKVSAYSLATDQKTFCNSSSSPDNRLSNSFRRIHTQFCSVPSVHHQTSPRTGNEHSHHHHDQQIPLSKPASSHKINCPGCHPP